MVLQSCGDPSPVATKNSQWKPCPGHRHQADLRHQPSATSALLQRWVVAPRRVAGDPERNVQARKRESFWNLNIGFLGPAAENGYQIDATSGLHHPGGDVGWPPSAQACEHILEDRSCNSHLGLVPTINANDIACAGGSGEWSGTLKCTSGNMTVATVRGTSSYSSALACASSRISSGV